MVNRPVFLLATIIMLLFFLVSHYDAFFFPLHFLQSAIYLLILLLLFYGQDDWAYVMGVMAPLFWVVLTLVTGILSGGINALGRLLTFQSITSPVDMVTGLILLFALGLIGASAWAFLREVWGRPRALRTVLWSLVLVWVYYAVLIAVLFHMARPATET
ncbi:MAG: hypothetical protein ACE5MH_09950 [Terriglobia bacterium]